MAEALTAAELPREFGISAVSKPELCVRTLRIATEHRLPSLGDERLCNSVKGRLPRGAVGRRTPTPPLAAAPGLAVLAASGP